MDNQVKKKLLDIKKMLPSSRVYRRVDSVGIPRIDFVDRTPSPTGGRQLRICSVPVTHLDGLKRGAWKPKPKL